MTKAASKASDGSAAICSDLRFWSRGGTRTLDYEADAPRRTRTALVGFSLLTLDALSVWSDLDWDSSIVWMIIGMTMARSILDRVPVATALVLVTAAPWDWVDAFGGCQEEPPAAGRVRREGTPARLHLVAGQRATWTVSVKRTWERRCGVPLALGSLGRHRSGLGLSVGAHTRVGLAVRVPRPGAVAAKR
jgi:hypothetical protein